MPHPDPYRGKWSALSNTTLGVLMVTIDGSIVLISLPDIFRGIHLNPLTPGNTKYFLWLLMGYMVVTAVLVVSFGRLGDMFGRVRMYNLGFAVFSFFSVLLAITWMQGTAGALYMIIIRIFQGVGGALLFANSSAIITDAFPPNQRGMALGINQVSAISGTFIGLVLGGLLGPVDWRLVFLISVPVGIAGTAWAYISLKERGIRTPARIDWLGNVTFAVGLVSLLVGIVYGILPYGGHSMGWTNPSVLAALIGGAALLGLFFWIETKVESPMFEISLFRIRAFAMGNLASLLAALGRGGLMFILIIWLQGIWLPLHGYSFANTPLWAGIYMLPLTVGNLFAGPIAGHLSDRFGARPFATGGMLLSAVSFILLDMLPIDFNYVWFALLLAANGLGMGIFASPNWAGVMNSVPAEKRGQGAGMTSTVLNSAMVLSIGIFFTLIIVGLAAHLPNALYSGLTRQGVPPSDAARLAHLPPTSSVFGAFLGYSPIRSLLGPTGVLTHLPHAKAAYLTGRSFFPSLIAAPFAKGLHEAFAFAIAAILIAAAASFVPAKRATAVTPATAVDEGPLLGAGLAAASSLLVPETIEVGASALGNDAISIERSAGPNPRRSGPGSPAAAEGGSTVGDPGPDPTGGVGLGPPRGSVLGPKD